MPGCLDLHHGAPRVTGEGEGVSEHIPGSAGQCIDQPRTRHPGYPGTLGTVVVNKVQVVICDDTGSRRCAGSDKSPA